MADDVSVAYDAFMAQVDHNIETAGVSVDLMNAITTGDADAALAAVRAMTADACGKAKMLWTGSPVGTILRKTATGEIASRIITASEGIPMWSVVAPDGAKWQSHEPVLQPESDWVCIYNPSSQQLTN